MAKGSARAASNRKPVPILRSERLLMTLPDPGAAEAHLRFALDNREHLTPWEPPQAADYYTLPFWQERLRKNLDEFEQGLSLRLSIFWKPGARLDSPSSGFARGPVLPLRKGAVLGNCNFSNFVWGAFHAATVGYRLDHRVEGQGVMTEALRCAIGFLFREMGFHRIQANYRPTNERSGAVLRRLGFVVEGYARDYLFIDGAWRDHVLTSLTNPDMPGRPPRLPL
jgi:ribosomal-protein-alanine N-acetyltransferase